MSLDFFSIGSLISAKNLSFESVESHFMLAPSIYFQLSNNNTFFVFLPLLQYDTCFLHAQGRMSGLVHFHVGYWIAFPQYVYLYVTAAGPIPFFPAKCCTKCAANYKRVAVLFIVYELANFLGTLSANTFLHFVLGPAVVVDYSTVCCRLDLAIVSVL